MASKQFESKISNWCPTAFWIVAVKIGNALNGASQLIGPKIKIGGGKVLFCRTIC